MYGRSIVYVEATSTMLQMPMYKGIEECYGIWLHVFRNKLFVESERSHFSIGIVPVLHVYIGTITVQNSYYSSARVALFTRIAL